MDSRIDLPEVTLVAVSSMALAATVRAMERSLDHIRFGAAILLSHEQPQSLKTTNFVWRRINPITSRSAYSRFILRELDDHIETSHVLCIQWDGYVLSGASWDERFLDYDYIGAPWPHFTDGFTVGNGGFSLRSKKLLSACARLDVPPDLNEDVAICRTYRDALERDANIVFAPEWAAARFAYERCPPTGTEFGFHGVFNMAKFLEAETFQKIVKTLEIDLIASEEHRELLLWALRNCRFSMAWQISRRIIARFLRDRMKMASRAS